MSGENDFTPTSAFANMLRHWTSDQIREFYAMLSRRPECATPPGSEIVPEGTMEALKRAAISLGELANITTLSTYDYAALDACRKIIKAASTKKETPNAQG